MTRLTALTAAFCCVITTAQAQNLRSQTAPKSASSGINFADEDAPGIWPACPADLMRKAFASVTSDIAAIDMIMIETELHNLCTDRALLIKSVVEAETELTTSVRALRDAQAASKGAQVYSAADLNALVSQRVAEALAERAPAASATSETILGETAQDDQTASVETACPTPRPIKQVYWTLIGQGGNAPQWAISLVNAEQYDLSLIADPHNPIGRQARVHIGEPWAGVTVIDVAWGEGSTPHVVTAQDCEGVAAIKEAPAAYASYPDAIPYDADGNVMKWQGGVKILTQPGFQNQTPAKIPEENKILEGDTQ